MRHKHAHATGDCSDKSRPDRSMSTNLCVDSWISSVNQSCCPNERRSARTYLCRGRKGQRGAVLIFFPPLSYHLSLTPSFESSSISISSTSVPMSPFRSPSFPPSSTFPFTSSLFLLSPSPPYILFFIMIPSSPLSLQLCRWLNHEWCKRCVSFFLSDNVCEPKTPQQSMERERER